ncbi:hypothetical protein [Leptothermofonsia sp. ETS-13]|uniref:hypothetical protein n=1 Tax=Leptothermofonsia sp. ETS-13 TaxID=3035696 RepID=UPI003B9FB710
MCKIEIHESEAELKELLRDQKTASSKERSIYRLKAKLKVPRPRSIGQQPQQMTTLKKPLLLV